MAAWRISCVDEGAIRRQFEKHVSETLCACEEPGSEGEAPGVSIGEWVGAVVWVPGEGSPQDGFSEIE